MNPEFKAKLEAAKLQRLQAAQTETAAAATAEGIKLESPSPAADTAKLAASLAVAAETAKIAAKLKESDEVDPVEALTKMRIYRSRVPGSSFAMPGGYMIYFTGGWYETSDEAEIKELDKVANKTPTIYTEEHEAEIIAAVIEARRQGFAGSIGDAMTQQLTVEQRLNALRNPGGGASALPTVLQLPSTGGIAHADAVKADAAMIAALKAQSNSK